MRPRRKGGRPIFATFDRDRTLDELEGKVSRMVDDGTYLVQTLLRLRTKPLKDFTDGDLRVMILQKMSTPFLVPLALERLDLNPLTEGDYFPGDLLNSVLLVQPQLWQDHPEWYSALAAIFQRAKRRKEWAKVGKHIIGEDKNSTNKS